MSYSAPPVITQSFAFGGAPGGISGNPKQLNSSILSEKVPLLDSEIEELHPVEM